MEEGKPAAIALYDKERRGIFIHADRLRNSPFRPGDRFRIYPRPSEIFSLTLIKHENGEILFDRLGIFVPRTRRVDMLLGGIFARYAIFIEPKRPGTLSLRPLAGTPESSPGGDGGCGS